MRERCEETFQGLLWQERMQCRADLQEYKGVMQNLKPGTADLRQQGCLF